MAQYAAFILTQEAVEDISEKQTLQPSWVREDNIASYELNVPNRVIRQNYCANENRLASPPQQRHTLGIIAGNDVSRVVANPQDVESDLRNLTRPLTNCPARQYKPLLEDQDKIVINNRKTNLVIDVRPVHLPEYQMWGYAPVYAPLPLVKTTCGRPEKY
jgi:hypothetical protein